MMKVRFCRLRQVLKVRFTNPVLIDEDNGIIAGQYGRVLAARKLGINKVPSIKLSHLTDIQKSLYHCRQQNSIKCWVG